MPIIRKKTFADMLEGMSNKEESKDDGGGSIAGLMKAIWEKQGKKEEDISADEKNMNKFENMNAMMAGEQESPDNEWGLDKSDSYGSMAGDLDKLSRFAKDSLAPKNKQMMDESGIDLSGDENEWDNYRKKMFRKQML